MDNSKSSEAKRLPAADGLRGLLAIVVMAWHVTERFGWGALYIPSQIAVCGFFALSGYVLTRAYDGRYGLFLIRRFVRLWPVFAVTLAVGYAAAAVHPQWSQFLWYPLLSPTQKPWINPPMWSLRIEAWAMLFMPFFYWAGTGKVWRVLAALILVTWASDYYVMFAFGRYFVIGAFLSRWEFRERFLETPAPQWLGRISYSLYLSHWIVISLGERLWGNVGVLAAVPVSFAVGWLVWRYVEKPSIAWSRGVGAIAAFSKIRRLAVVN